METDKIIVIYSSTQFFYYVLLSLSFLGFIASVYTFMHTGHRKWGHRASSITNVVFLVMMVVSIFGVGGNLPEDIARGLILIVTFLMALVALLRAADILVDNLVRQRKVCKEKEFQRHRRKQRDRDSSGLIETN